VIKIDLHTHSSISDGELSPWQLVKIATEKELTTIALTDHDTIDGIDQARSAGKKFGIDIIPGVEFSVNHEDGSMHLLGYYIDHHNSELIRIISKLKSSRSDRNEKIVARLNELGYNVKIGDVLRLSPEGTCGRTHIAKVLVASGKFKTVSDVFDELIGHGCPAYLDRYRLQLKDAIELIHNAGGVAVWAHPGNHGKKMDRMLDRLSLWKSYGLDGLESDYATHSIILRDRLRKIALENGLIYTGGSDFHGSSKPDNQLGVGPEGVEISKDCLVMLQRSKQQNSIML